ncbi:hypothetical protein [Streptomyces sp. DHE17-7]|uniref:hypothetical protein n=1 Tax=Streptomyces sp. DHE17-7 TaxID=2759949 RepID=UPI0022EAF236|nr:hypothetical protein [Streptomyces sp. DHE17-7]
MLLGGRLADALGARRTLLFGLALFTAASLVTGLAENADGCLGRRIRQGSAGLLSPAALSIVTTTFHGATQKAARVGAAIGAQPLRGSVDARGADQRCSSCPPSSRPALRSSHGSTSRALCSSPRAPPP